jgi:hypothetical protein
MKQSLDTSITAALGDTPEQLHAKLARSNELLARAYADLIAYRASTAELGMQISYLLQLRRAGHNAVLLGHLDAVDKSLNNPQHQVH